MVPNHKALPSSKPLFISKYTTRTISEALQLALSFPKSCILTSRAGKFLFLPPETRKKKPQNPLIGILRSTKNIAQPDPAPAQSDGKQFVSLI